MPIRQKKASDALSQWELIKNQRTTWLFPALTVLIIVVSLGLVLVPQMNQILEIRQEIASESELLARLETKRAFLEGLSESDLTESLTEANRALPSRKPVYEIIEALSSELGESGITLKTYELKPGDISSDSADKQDETQNVPGMLSSLLLSFEASGTRESVVTFLTRLNVLAPLTGFNELIVNDDALLMLPLFESAGSFGRIENIEISVDEEDLVSLEGDLVLYYSLPPAVAGKMSDELPKKATTDATVLERVRSLEAYRKDTVEMPLEIDNQREDLFRF